MTMIKSVFSSLGLQGLYRLESYSSFRSTGWTKVALKVSLVCGAIGLVALALRARGIRLHNDREFNRILKERAKNPPGYNIRITDGEKTLAVIKYDKTQWENELNTQLVKCNAQWKKVYMTLEAGYKDWIFPVEITDLIFKFFKNSASAKDLCNSRLVCKQWQKIIDEPSCYYMHRFLGLAKNAIAGSPPDAKLSLLLEISEIAPTPENIKVTEAALRNESCVADPFNNQVKEHRATALIQFAKIVPKRDNITAAKNAIPAAFSGIQNEYERVKKLTQIAAIEPSEENIQAARNELKSIVPYHVNKNQQAKCSFRIAEISREDGDIEVARQASIEQDKAGWRAMDLAKIAELTRNEEDIKAAREASKVLNDADYKSEHLVDIAELTRNEEDIKAARVASMASDDTDMKVRSLIKIAKITRNEEDIKAARVASMASDNTVMKVRNLIKIATFFYISENVDAARDAINKVVNADEKAGFLTEFAELTKLEKDVDAAKQAINQTHYTEEHWRACDLLKFAGITGNDEDIMAAMESIKKVEYFEKQVSILIYLLKRDPSKKNIKDVEAIVAASTNAYYRARAYSTIARTLKMDALALKETGQSYEDFFI